MTLDLVQNKQKLTGTFMVTTGNATPSGSVTGTITGDAIHATFHATGGPRSMCTAEGAAVVDGNEMSGTYIVHGNKKNCGRSTGTFNLTRQ